MDLGNVRRSHPGITEARRLARLARTVLLKRLSLRDGHVNRNTCERTHKAVVEYPANCNKRVGTRYIDPDYMGKKGGQHVMELAGLGCVDILGTPVRRRNDSERE